MVTMKNTWSHNINNGIDDNVRNMQALALLLANTSNVIDTVVEKINSQLQLNIKDHQTVVALSIIRSENIQAKSSKSPPFDFL